MTGFTPLQPYPYKNNTNTSSGSSASNLTVTTLHVLTTSQFDGAVIMSSSLNVAGTLTAGVLVVGSITIGTLTVTGQVNFTANIPSTTTTTGTLVITGGLGVSGQINCGSVNIPTAGVNAFQAVSTSNVSTRIAFGIYALDNCVAGANGAFSTDALAGDAVIRGNRLLLQSGSNGAALVIDTSNNTTIKQILALTANIASTSTTTGTLQITGGAGISGNASIGAQATLYQTSGCSINIVSADNASVSQIGSLFTSGGIYVTKDIYCGGTISTASITSPRIITDNLVINQTAISTGTTTLTNTSTEIQVISGSGNSTVQLPDATTLVTSQAYFINNNGTGTLVLKNGAGTTIGTYLSGAHITAYCISKSTSAGVWDIVPNLPTTMNMGNSLAQWNGTLNLGRIVGNYLNTFGETGSNAMINLNSSNASPACNILYIDPINANQWRMGNNGSVATFELIFNDTTSAMRVNGATGVVTFPHGASGTEGQFNDIILNPFEAIGYTTQVQLNSNNTSGHSDSQIVFNDNFNGSYWIIGTDTAGNFQALHAGVVYIQQPIGNTATSLPLGITTTTLSASGATILTANTASTTTTTGTLVITGGLGLTGQVNCGSVNIPTAGLNAFQAISTSNVSTRIAYGAYALDNCVAAANGSFSIDALVGDAVIRGNRLVLQSGSLGAALIINTSNNVIVYQILSIISNIAATSTTSGALQVTGGVGITGDVYIGGTLYASLAPTTLTATSITTNPTNAVSPVDQVILNSSTALHHSNAHVVINDNYHTAYWTMGTATDGDFNLAHNTTNFLVAPIGDTATEFPLGISTPSITTTGNIDLTTGGISNDATNYAQFSANVTYTPTILYTSGIGSSAPAVTPGTIKCVVLYNGFVTTIRYYCTFTYTTTATHTFGSWVLQVTCPPQILAQSPNYAQSVQICSSQTTIDGLTGLTMAQYNVVNGNITFFNMTSGLTVTNQFQAGASGSGTFAFTMTY